MSRGRRKREFSGVAEVGLHSSKEPPTPASYEVINMNFVSHQTIEAKTVTVTGKAIAARLARRLQDDRALLALDLVNGKPIPRQSRRRAAKLMNVSRYRVESAELATADEIECLKLGRLSLAHVRKAHAPAKPVKMSDAEVDALVDCIGADRFLEALDRVTAPVAIAAE